MPRPISKVKNAQNGVRLKTILRDKKKKARFWLLVCGVVFIVAGLYLSNPVPRELPTNTSVTVNNAEVVSFSQEPVTVDKSLLTQPKNSKNKIPPSRILISSVGIDVTVKEAKVVKGYWEVFSDSAGFGLGSAYPDDIGNQVIFAHAREGLFLPLKNVKTGEKVLVLTKDKWYSYEIKNIQEVLPSQTEVIAPTTEAILTLYTCTGFSGSKRLIVTAKRI